MKKFSLFLALLSAALLLGSGCASTYHVKPTLDPALRDVFVPSVKNTSNQPEIARELTKALQREVMRSGTLRLVSESEASTRLDVTVTDFTQHSYTTHQRFTDDPNRYEMKATAKAAFTRIGREQAGVQPAVIWSSDSISDSESFRANDAILGPLQSQEDEKLTTLPVIAEEMARQIVEGCVGAW